MYIFYINIVTLHIVIHNLLFQFNKILWTSFHVSIEIYLKKKVSIPLYGYVIVLLNLLSLDVLIIFSVLYYTIFNEHLYIAHLYTCTLVSLR